MNTINMYTATIVNVATKQVMTVKVVKSGGFHKAQTFAQWNVVPKGHVMTQFVCLTTGQTMS